MAITLPQLDIVTKVVNAFAHDGAKAVDLTGPWGSGKSLVAAQAALALNCSLLVITPGRGEAERVHEDLGTLLGPERCALFPAWEVLPTETMAPSDDIVAERMNTLERLTSAFERGELMYVVVPVGSLLQYVADRNQLRERIITLGVGEEHDLEDLVGKLVRAGYKREVMVEQRGEVSVRGGILDIFPISGELPIRVEFFGDEIESIRRFEPETQRSVNVIEQAQILPRSEKGLLIEAGNAVAALTPVTSYLPDNTLAILDEPLNIREEAELIERQFHDSVYLMSWNRAFADLGRFLRLSLAQVAHDRLAGDARFTEPMHAVSGWAGNIAGFWKQVQQWDLMEYTVVLACNNPGERNRLLELLDAQGYRPGHGRFDLRVELGTLAAGFTSAADRLAVLSEREIFGRHYVRRTRRRFEAGTTVTTFSDLKSGDYVVHATHGIGRYVGLRRFPGKSGDFLALQYSGGDMLYVPVTNIDMVQKYVAGEGSVPKVDRLGGATWARTKSRVKKAVRDMTQELIKLYAAREAHDGFSFAPDTPWQFEFEDAFEYDETRDQLRAIAEVKGDMQSRKPMDRLICGDVGYGKTEVALRAAFKAVMDSRQVAVLVPTTILAQQHFATFSERLADYPIHVEVLSRFRSAKQQKVTIEQLKSGEVDVIIGTHRLTSKDIVFKDLGLVIIDEEHRFGVAQKEKLKALRTNVDVITLSATPIPRTLQLSLSGIRDMSIINTAPNDRLPIHTCIEAFDPALIQEAILREMRREGQVFYLHNRVQTILSVAESVRKLVPTARIGIAHGQMHEHELEDVMSAFIHKDIDVLVCTSIIGSGLDIPNANTIIVDRADNFGLADLYQLRGRVGRYKHRAFAYLLIPGNRVPTEDAQKRLKALEEFSSLGSGFRIAMRDMEIRGCGNILGGQQHGHMLAVGYDTYAQMIKEAAAEIKGEPIIERVLPAFEVAVDAYIPEEYVSSETQKITLYKRIAGLLSVDAVKEMHEELTDRFGKPPVPVRRLLDVMRVRALAADVGATAIAAAKNSIRIEFESAHLLTTKARGLLGEFFAGKVTIEGISKPTLKLELSGKEDFIAGAERLLRALADI